MRIFVILCSIFLLSGCVIYYAAQTKRSWDELHKMYKEANGRQICMKYTERVYVMYYCENSNKNTISN